MRRRKGAEYTPIHSIIRIIGSRRSFSRMPISVIAAFAGLVNFPRNTRWYIHSM